MEFVWLKGTKNAAIINELNKYQIPWEYDHFGKLIAKTAGKWEKVSCNHVSGDLFKIIIGGMNDGMDTGKREITTNAAGREADTLRD